MNRAALDAVTRRIQIVSSALGARGGTSGKAQQSASRVYSAADWFSNVFVSEPYITTILL